MRPVSFTLNGKPTRVTVDENRPLLWVLRDDLGLTGTKFGCGEGHCGSCTVLVNNEAVRSCAMSIGDVAGKKVTTIEGLAAGGRLNAVQDAFVRHTAFQCGYCTPGMILTVKALLDEHPGASGEEVRRYLAGNICRCTGYVNIMRAVDAARQRLGRAPTP